MKALLCAMNASLCDVGFSPQLLYVVIPQASPRPMLQTETRLLQDKNVRTWVAERVLLESDRNEVTDAYLAAGNPESRARLRPSC
jgi:hypothetical protein